MPKRVSITIEGAKVRVESVITKNLFLASIVRDRSFTYAIYELITSGQRQDVIEKISEITSISSILVRYKSVNAAKLLSKGLMLILCDQKHLLLFSQSAQSTWVQVGKTECHNQQKNASITNLSKGHFMVSGSSLSLFSSNHLSLKQVGLIDKQLTYAPHSCLVVSRSTPQRFSIILQRENTVVIQRITINFKKRRINIDVMMQGNFIQITSLDLKKRFHAMALGQQVDRLVTFDNKRKVPSSIIQTTKNKNQNFAIQPASQFQLYKLMMLNQRLISIID